MAETVFLSHSSKDIDLAWTLIEELEKRDLSIWFAPREIRGGEFYGARLVSAIPKCDAFLLLASRHSIGSADGQSRGSKHVLIEMQTAMESDKTMIPLDVDGRQEEGCHLEFAYLLKLSQYIDIRGATATGNLAHSCDTIADAIRNHSTAVSAQPKDPLKEIEVSLKQGDYSTAQAGLAAVGRSPQHAERAELLQVIARLQRTGVPELNKTTADALVGRLMRLRNGKEQSAVLYVLGALSVHFYQAFHMYDQTGGAADLKSQSKALPRVAAKYSIMMSHAIPKNSRFNLDWRS